ncbi:MAG: RNA polymerase sigma factor, partial [Firmicutes bacterium]|nr:RNA polymerase sigma factor [Bacillota bacterium]
MENPIDNVESINFEEMVCEHKQYIFSLAYRLTGRREEAEDLAQETFLSAWKSVSQLREKSAVLPWLRKICVNAFLQKKRKRYEVMEISNYDIRQLEEEDRQLRLSSPSPTPEEEFLVDEAIQEFKDNCFTAMATRLSLEQRVTFALVDVFGLNVVETAVLLNRSLSATKALLHRARRNLNAFFGRYCQWVLPENACHCVAWLEFTDRCEALRKEARRLNLELPDFNDATYARHSDPETLEKVLALFRNLPLCVPDEHWFEKVKE